MNQKECLSWIERDKKVVALCQHLTSFPLVVESGSGDIIVDVDGNRYIDFLSSASSLNLGSSFPLVIDAISEQIKKTTQYCTPYTYSKQMIEYAERLTSVYPGNVKAKICFGNSGSDASDAAIKFARAYTGRKKIISFINSYHGNTLGATSLSACTIRMREKIGPLLPEIYHFTFKGCNDNFVSKNNLIGDIEQAFSTYLPPSDVAAVIIEPMQGDGGLNMALPEFIHQLYALCKKYGILFISDEVQQGFFRNNHWFGIENFNVVPDGVILGKSLGAGLVLGAFMAKSEIIDSLQAPAHAFTLAGHQLACAAGIAQFDYLTTNEFKSILSCNTKLLKELIAQTINEMGHSIIQFAHGSGMSYGISIVNPFTRIPDVDATHKVVYRCYEYGLLMISVAGNILRIQPPLNISRDNLIRGFEILNQAVYDVEKGLVPDNVLEYRKGW